ncbi:MAG TPA: hypothetical protein VMU50_21325 [Polyangia bacterium]|nr:hypothetical protein [Polyangia bacterium]
MNARSAARLAAVALALAVAVAARPVAAYVRYITESPYLKPFQWMQSCVHVTGYPNQDDFPDMTPDQVATAATRAAAAWSTADNTCTFLNIDVMLSSAPAPKAVADNRSSLIFRHQDWCAPTDSPWVCSYDQAALAITSVFVQRSTGRIQEADIEVNDRYFSWTDLDINPDKTKQDLQNALTHEMGHLIGLDHTCYNPSPSIVRPTDNNGNPVPDCATAPPAVRATTMFASATPGDTSKRTLEPDDKQAICDIYPLASDPAFCPADGTSNSSAVDNPGCALAGGAAPGTPWPPAPAAGLAWALVLAASRRPSRARRGR